MKHFRACLAYHRIKGANVKNVDLFEDFFNENRQPKAMTSDRLCEYVLQILVAGNLSFRQAENPKLQELLAIAFPNCDPPNERSVVQHLTSEAQLSKGNLRGRVEAIDSRMSLALDAWHSKVGNMEFLGISPRLGFEMISGETGKSPPWRLFFSIPVSHTITPLTL